MNSTIRTALILGSLAGILAQQASADTAATQPLYGDELQRCVVALRPEAADVGAATARHTVTEVTVRGMWREFTIESAYTAKGGTALGDTVSHCRTARWGSGTELNVVARHAPSDAAVAEARLAAR